MPQRMRVVSCTGGRSQASARILKPALRFECRARLCRNSVQRALDRAPARPSFAVDRLASAGPWAY